MSSRTSGLSMIRDATEIQSIANAVATVQNVIQIADVANLPNALNAVNTNISNTVSNLNTANNTIATINNNLSTKQNKLTIQTAGAGAPVIDALNNVRNIFGVAPISVLIYFDPFSPTNSMNSNIQLSFDNTLTNLTNYYTSTVSDAKYQLKLTASTPLNLANNILSIDLTNYPTLANLSS